MPVRYTAVAQLGGRLYLFGGELSDGTDSDAIQSVDLATGDARVAGRLPNTLAHASAIALAGRILVLGGREAGSAGGRVLTFDPATGRVSSVGRLPQPLTNSAAVAIGDNGYLVGGLDANTTPVSSVIRLAYGQ